MGVTTTDAAFDQLPAAELTGGTVGSTLSMFAVAAGSPGTAGAHGEAFPALSSARNCTQVVPVVDAVKTLPGAVADQWPPASALVRYW